MKKLTLLSIATSLSLTALASLPLSLVALGVVFGDIGTSPLYAFKECLRDGATPADVYSFVSLDSLEPHPPGLDQVRRNRAPRG